MRVRHILLLLLIINVFKYSYSEELYYFNNLDKIMLKKVENQYAIQFEFDVKSEEKSDILKAMGIEVLCIDPRDQGYSIVNIKNQTILERLNSLLFIKHLTPVLELENGTRCMVPNQFFVKFKHYISKEKIEELSTEFHAIFQKNIGYRDSIYVFRTRSSNSLTALHLANTYNSFPEVEFAVPNLYLNIKPSGIVSNDPLLTNQWNLNKIKIQNAWELSKGASEIIVAVLDDGVDLLHEDLINQFYRDENGNLIGLDATTQGDNSPMPTGPDAHGTACSGIIAAQTNNQIGIAGINWDVKIMPVQIYYNPDTPLGWPYLFNFDFIWAINGIEYAMQNDADVISMSWQTSFNLALEYELQNAATFGRNQLGCVLVAASGNGYGSITFPATLDQYVIAVGATDENDVHWAYSNYGVSLDVVAPSGNISPGLVYPLSGGCPNPPQKNHKVFELEGNIWTTDLSGTDSWGAKGYYPDNCYYQSLSPGGTPDGKYSAKFSGTSAACPHVSGLAALVLSINPDLTREQVQTIIQNSATDLGDPGYDIYYGHGRINAYEALKYTLENYGGALSQNLNISENETWNINAGVTIKFENNCRLIVDGTLNISGTVEAPVILKSTNPSPQNVWNGIFFNSTSAVTSNLENCIIEDASVGIQCDNSSLHLSNTKIRNCYYYGLSIIGSSNVELEGCEISNCSQFGAFIDDGASLNISFSRFENNGSGYDPYESGAIINAGDFQARNSQIDGNNGFGFYSMIDAWTDLGIDSEGEEGTNAIFDNSVYAIDTYSDADVMACGNWWGSEAGPNPNTDFHGTGTVEFEPWLDEYPEELPWGDNQLSGPINAKESDLNLFLAGKKALKKGRVELAGIIYKKLITQYPNSYFA